MKILMVSMNSIHFVRWTQQLENSGHEVFWFDILDGGKAKGLPWVHQFIGWKQKYPNFKGRYFIKNRLLHLIVPLIPYPVRRPIKETIAFFKNQF